MATKKLKTIEISHKDKKTGKVITKNYVPINERVKAFREMFPAYSLLSSIEHIDGKRIIIKASILDDNGREIANGIASEVEGSSNINAFSHVENCETSAWGRALANIGIGIDESIASADEVANALNQQADIETPSAKEFSETTKAIAERGAKIDKIKELLNATGITPKQFIETMHVHNITELTDEQIDDAIKRLEAKLESAGDK